MADTQSTGSGAAGIDLTQFYQVFFEEAGENLATMEQMLLGLDLTRADDEELNAIFRCAHSVKGGAATFGFADVAELTHQMETLLDKLRRHELEPQTRMVDVLLAAGDALKAQLARHQGAGGEAVDTRALIGDIMQLASGAAARRPPRCGSRRPPRRAGARTGRCKSRPQRPAASVCSSSRWDRCPTRRSPTACSTCSRRSPSSGRWSRSTPATAPTACAASRSLTKSSDGDLLDLFTFHVPREALKLGPLTRGYGFHKNAPGAPKDEPADQGYGFFADAPGAPAHRHGAERGRGGRAKRRGARARGGQARRKDRRARSVDAARVGRQGRPADQSGGRAGHHAGDAGADRPEHRFGSAPEPHCRPGRPAAQHARPAGSGDVDPHDSDVGGVQPLSAHAARPGRQARQEGRAGDAGRGHRARQGPGGEDHRPADAPGAQLVRPRHRAARRAARQGQGGARHHHAGAHRTRAAAS